MKCETARKILLSLPDPRLAPSDLGGHLRACGDCRRERDRLLALERAVLALPVPSSVAARSAFLTRFRSGATHRQPASRIDVFGFARRQWRVIASAAAAVLVAAIGLAWWANTHSPAGFVKAPADPLLARLMQRDLDLATASDAGKRARTLADLADDLSAQTRTLARVAPGDDLAFLAKQYRKVVFQGLITQAGRLDPAERKQVVRELQERLTRAGRDADEAAGEVPAASAAALRDIAEAARQAGRQLHELNREGGAS